MRVLLCAINAKYIHVNLAVLYLHQVGLAAGWHSQIRSFSINEPIGYILSELHQHQADVVAFSCYIWNIEMVMKLAADMRKVRPEAMIVLGGPEVSYRADQILRENPAVDYVISGEGETVWPQLLAAWHQGINHPNLPGVSYREGADIITAESEAAALPVLDGIPFPYEGIRGDHSQIIYYESSRGCPFQCSYCLSSLQREVRFFPLERVKRDLERLIQLNPREIKFVDRTFNCDESRARAIMEMILQLPGQARFHMEISPQLLSDKFLSFLEKLPGQRFAFEIGVQSTHEPTLKAIKRLGDWSRISSNISRLRQADNIHLHLDLIAGLPEEDYPTFMNSFNQVYNLKPHHLQLGFLKMLPGTGIRRQAQNYQYQYQQHPPYEVLSTDWLSFEELVHLHHIEDVLEKYYNAGLARLTVEQVIARRYNGNAFSFWERLGQYWHHKGYYGIGVGLNERYTILKQYLDEQYPQLSQQHHDWLKYDYLQGRLSYHLPVGLHGLPQSSEMLTKLLKQDGFIAQYLPEFTHSSIREIKKRVILERFQYHLCSGPAATDPLTMLFVYPQPGQGAGRIVPLYTDLLD
ncbi:MAG: DUF4080 domain-containing protein [Syntrophomonadaceae bacterium]|jgi:radical SAM superfamily enzyme YgiQ (UPF0313 family)